MFSSRRLAMLISVIAVAGALPAGALAQSAGDDQYADPLGEDTPTQTTPAPAPAPATPAPVAPAAPAAEQGTDDGAVAPAAAQGSPAAAPAAAAPAELARTGANPWLLALAGAALVLLGIGLRARTADARP